jgi:hypothetical protein
VNAPQDRSRSAPGARPAFPRWGLVALPVGVLSGTAGGGLLGAWLGDALIGAAIGAALGIGTGLALLAAAVVVASARF